MPLTNVRRHSRPGRARDINPTKTQGTPRHSLLTPLRVTSAQRERAPVGTTLAISIGAVERGRIPSRLKQRHHVYGVDRGPACVLERLSETLAGLVSHCVIPGEQRAREWMTAFSGCFADRQFF